MNGAELIAEEPRKFALAINESDGEMSVRHETMIPEGEMRLPPGGKFWSSADDAEIVSVNVGITFADGSKLIFVLKLAEGAVERAKPACPGGQGRRDLKS